MLAASMRPTILLLLACAALVLAACGEKKEPEVTSTPAATTAAATPDAGAAGCQKVAAPKPHGEQHLAKPTAALAAGKTWVATVTTSCGVFEITLDTKRAPKTAASFAYLARKSFFDGLTFHRIVPGFVIQGGDPLGSGQGGPGYSIREKPPADLTYTRGVVAMAKTGAEPAGTSGSQFFVVTGEDAGLPPDYALLGKVTKGADVVDEIGTVQTDPSTEAPTSPVVIASVKITSR
jgi:cyclophilin family peptidyl-prolyl cis-trans isomerase